MNIKKLYVVRHAKSSWGDANAADFDRTLNDRGKRDAPVMAKRLKDRDVQIDHFISSPAKRAKSTCKAFCKVYGYDEKDIQFIDALYHAPVDTFKRVVASIDDSHASVAIFSHNPGITEFVNTLVPGVHVDNMPTCAVFAVQFSTEKWEDFLDVERNFLFIDYPKLSS